MNMLIVCTCGSTTTASRGRILSWLKILQKRGGRSAWGSCLGRKKGTKKRRGRKRVLAARKAGIEVLGP